VHFTSEGENFYRRVQYFLLIIRSIADVTVKVGNYIAQMLKDVSHLYLHAVRKFICGS
jgi:hypothetical protein